MSLSGKGFAKAPAAAGSVSSLQAYSCSVSDSHLGRRRKIRCKYNSEDESICIGCRTRGSRCQSQEFVANEPSDVANTAGLADRVARLENMIEALLHKVDAVYDRLDSGSQPPSKLPPNLGIDVITPCASPCYPHETAPLLSLFDSAIVGTPYPILANTNENEQV